MAIDEGTRGPAHIRRRGIDAKRVADPEGARVASEDEVESDMDEDDENTQAEAGPAKAELTLQEL